MPVLNVRGLLSSSSQHIRRSLSSPSRHVRYLRYPAIIASGLLLFFSISHTNFLLAWICLIPLYIVLFDSSPRQALFTGLLTGLVLSVCAFEWMIPGSQTFTGNSSWYGVAVFLACTLVFSAYWAALLGAFVWLRSRTPGFPALLAACCWVSAEAGLQQLAQHMPWFLFHTGNALSANLYAIQPVSLAGIHGATVAIVLVNYWTAHAIRYQTWKYCWKSLLTLSIYMSAGVLLFHQFNNSTPPAAPPPFQLAILAENIPPDIEWNDANGTGLVEKLLRLEQQAADQRPDMIGWSESAIPWTYTPQDDLVKELVRITQPAKITQLLGMNTACSDNIVYNSAWCLLPDGRVSGRYDKKILLSAIEQPWNGWLIPFFSGNGFSVRAGTNDLPLPTPYGRAGILICNESAIPAAAAAKVRQGAQFLFNMSNDGWFRDTYLVNLHFYNARLRAVETRKDIAINSNDGFSGLINASGEIMQSRHSDTAFVTVVPIHPNDIRTSSTNYPNLPVYCCLLLVLGALGYSFRHRLPYFKPIK